MSDTPMTPECVDGVRAALKMTAPGTMFGRSIVAELVATITDLQAQNTRLRLAVKHYLSGEGNEQTLQAALTESKP